MRQLLSIAMLALFAFLSMNAAANPLKTIPELANAGVLLVDQQGATVIAAQAEQSFIPASTTKLVTAWLALQHWGEAHQFETAFYLDSATQVLWIKGGGDPFLVSEELQLIAAQLAQLGLSEIAGLGIDTHLFSQDLRVPGASRSNNPYDAIPTALAANFNTINVKRVAGKIVSAEAQTPMTATAKQIAVAHRVGTKPLRVNTGFSRQQSERYFAELMAAFLRQQDIAVGEQIEWGNVPNIPPYYQHRNSKTLADVIRPMMQYSTNFIANQLILMLSAAAYQQPANFADVQRYMETTLTQHFGWQDFTLKEGAGLSRDNRLSPRQLVSLLDDFKPWKHLLPEVSPGIFAKSGTLNKVSTLAGYRVDAGQQWQAFALMMRQSVRHTRRKVIIRKLSKSLD